MKKMILGLMILSSFSLFSQYEPQPNSEYWTIYCYQNLGEQNFRGYYTQKLDLTGNFGANTSLSWRANNSPSDAQPINNTTGEGTGYHNSIENSNSSNITEGTKFSFVHIRKGFPPGIYTFVITWWDDDTEVYLDDVNISKLERWGTQANIIEPCVYLGQNSKIKILTNNTGGGDSGFSFEISLKPYECSQLPVELISFTGKNKLGINTLFWETASETNNDYFTIEHSSDGFNWSIINKIKGKGNSMSSNSYNFEHRDYPNTINYYRLSQTDYDGKSEIFPIKSIDNLTEIKLIKRSNTLGQEVATDFEGMVIEVYSDGNTAKRIYR